MISVNDMSNLARALIDADADCGKVECLLKEKNEKARLLREETIPAAMQELGLESITLNTGQKLTIKQDVYASIPKENKPIAFNWLNENGFGGLIKISVDVEYGKGEAEVALALYKELIERGLTANVQENVHASTLKAFLREQMSKAAKIPMDIFGARPVWLAKITNK